MTRIIAAAIGCLLISVGGAEAAPRRHGSVHFRTGHCKRASCYRKHPSGSYVYPIGGRRRHR